MSVKFSVCIPVWNDAEWLSGAIESVLAQRYQDWELVIGDNASTQDVASVVARYPDSRIRYHRWEHHTDAYENFNRASQLGRYDWVQPISADDRLEPDCLQAMAERLENASAMHVRIGAVITNCKRLDPEGNPADVTFAGHQRTTPIRNGTYSGPEWLDVMSMPRQAPWNIGSIAFSREILVESGWFRPDIGYGADLELVLRVAAYGSIIYIEDKLFIYTVRGVSDSLARSLRTLADPRTPMRAAWESAIRAHSAASPMPDARLKRIRDVMARSHIQRALQQRLWSETDQRRKAAQDVYRAFSLRPGLLLSPWHLGAASLAVVAPKAAISLSLQRLTAYRRGVQNPAALWRV